MKKFVVYLTVYNGTKLPPYYIGSSTEDKVNKGYHGTVLSKKWKTIYKEELKNNPFLFRTSILSWHDTRQAALEEERRIQIELDVVNSHEYFNEAIAAPNGYFGRDVSGELNPFFGKVHDKETMERIVENIKITMSDPEWKIKFGEKQSMIQSLSHNRVRNSDNQIKAQNREDVKLRKSEKMNELFSDDKFKMRHKDSCRTEKFIQAQKKFRIGKKWINNIHIGEQIYVNANEIDSYLKKGWSLGMLSRKR